MSGKTALITPSISTFTLNLSAPIFLVNLITYSSIISIPLLAKMLSPSSKSYSVLAMVIFYFFKPSKKSFFTSLTSIQKNSSNFNSLRTYFLIKSMINSKSSEFSMEFLGYSATYLFLIFCPN